MTGRYYLRSFGCQMNEHDAERIRALLEAEGLERADEPDDADVLVYNTCTVRKSADDRLAGHLGTAARLKREDPARVVLVTGCLPQAEQAGFFARFPFVDGALGPQNLHRLPELLHAAVEPAGEARAGFFEDGPHFSGSLAARRERPFQAWVQVMSGCTNFCSYCIVPVRARAGAQPARRRAHRRGRAPRRGRRPRGHAPGPERQRLRPRPAARGRGVTLRAFAGLLRRLDAIDGLERIRFMTSHPKDLGDDLVAAVAELPSVCEHVHLPAQAGSDRVLRRHAARLHGRPVPRARARPPCRRAGRQHHDRPHRRLSRGDRGRLREDPRPRAGGGVRRGVHVRVLARVQGTAAAESAGPGAARTCAASAWSASSSSRNSRRWPPGRAWVGRRAEVLIEGTSRDGVLRRGRTRQNVTVNVAGAVEPGAIVTVEITAATSTTLRGTV